MFFNLNNLLHKLNILFFPFVVRIIKFNKINEKGR